MRNISRSCTLLAMLVVLLVTFGCGGGGGGGGGPSVVGPGSVVSGYTLQPGEFGISGAAFFTYSSLSNQTFGWGKQLGPYGTIAFGDKSVRTGTYIASSPVTNVAMTWTVADGVVTVTASTTPVTVYTYTQLAVNTAVGYYVMMKNQTNSGGASVFVDYERWYVGTGAAAAAHAYATTVTAFVTDLVAGKKLQNVDLSSPLWTAVTGTAPLGAPLGVAVDAGGAIYVVNSRSNTVQKFTTASTLPVWTGTTDSTPIGVAVDASGGIYVLNSTPNLVQQITVQKFTTASALPIGVGTVATVAAGTTTAVPTGIAIDASGGIYITCAQTNTLMKFTQPLAAPPAAPSTPLWTVPVGLNPSGVAVDTSGGVYVANYASNTVQKFDAATGTVLQWTGTTAAGPVAVAVDGSGGVYVVCASNVVQKFTPPATTPVWTGTTGSLPSSIAVDGSGGIYVTNVNSGTVQKFTPPATTPVWSGNTGLSPAGVAVDASGGIFVTNASSSTVEKFTVAGLTTVYTFFTNGTFSYTDTSGATGAGSWAINSNGTLTLNFNTNPATWSVFEILAGSTTSSLLLNIVHSDGTINFNILMTYI